jgi:5-methylcytosine-specific restriction endonuclease McrA
MSRLYNNGKWTEARFKTFITSILRGGSRKWAPKYETLLEAYTGQQVNPKTKRLSKHYKCQKCKKIYPGKEVNVDHIKPVVCPSDGFTSWDDYIERLYCEKENLQVLCTTCHDKKSLKEKTQRVSSRKKVSG